MNEKDVLEEIIRLEKELAEEKYKELFIKGKDNYADYVRLTHAYDPKFNMAPFQVYICDCIDKLLKNELLNDAGDPVEGITISLPTQHGKAIEDNVPVLTNKGFKCHGELEIGDCVYNQKGEQVRIMATQESYMHECMKIVLDTREEIICSKEHEWIIETNRDRKINGKRLKRQTEIVEAQNIFNGYHARSPAIRICEHLKNNDIDLPIPPYLLGLWLGDCCKKSTEISSSKNDCKEIAEYIEDSPVKILADNGENKRIIVGVTDGSVGSNKFRNGLKKFNLINNKHIPEIYFVSSYNQRLELFNGLMDSDGTVDKHRGICEFCNANKNLAEQFNVLARSLGYKSNITEGRATLYGRYISPKYRVVFVANKNDRVFKLKRKQERVNNKKPVDRIDKKRYFIKSVTQCGEYLVKCISVEGGVYLVGTGLIPTHNSRCITETLPSYFLGHEPYGHVIEASYNEDFAEKFGRRNKEKIMEFGKALFGIEISKDKTSSVEFELARTKGGMLSKGLTGGISGAPADLCFPAGTIIATENGGIEISVLLAMGNMPRILTYDHSCDKIVLKNIIAKRTRYEKEFIVVKTANGREIKSTRDHRYYTEAKGYTQAQLLGRNDILYSLDKKDMSTMRKVEVQKKQDMSSVLQPDTVCGIKSVRGESVKVYDIQVEGTHNFFANGILVHNCIVDDPYKNFADADSPSWSAEVIENWKSVLRMRASSICKFVVIHTRWNEDTDLIGYLLKVEPEKWFEIKFPLECEVDNEPVTGRNIGDALLPESGKNNEWLKEFKKSFMNDPLEGGLRSWNALCQQNPTTKGGNMIKKAYWQKYDLSLAMQKGKMFNEMIQSWDCSFKDTDGTDFVAGGVWGRIGAQFYLMDLDYERKDIVKTMADIKKMTRKWPKTLAKYIEDKANGPAVIQMMRMTVPGLIPVPAIKSKAERVNAVLPLWEAIWANEVIEQCAKFRPEKKVQKDDIVDICSMALGQMMYAFIPAEQTKRDIGYASPEELKDMGVISMDARRPRKTVVNW